MPPRPAAGTQTSDRYGNVISTRPAPTPSRPPAGPAAPTSDRWGHVVDRPVNTIPIAQPGPVNTVPPPVVVRPPPVAIDEAGPVTTVPPAVVAQPPVNTVPLPGNLPLVRPQPAPTPSRPPAGPAAPTSDRWGHVIDWK